MKVPSNSDIIEGVHLEQCPLCGGAAKLFKGYSGRESWHWPKISCDRGHTFRLFDGKPHAGAEQRLVDDWNDRSATGEM